MIDSINKKLFDYDSNFKTKLSKINLPDFYNEHQLAYFHSEPFIRYISSEAGLKLRKEPSNTSDVIETMSRGDKFFITKFSGINETIGGKKGQWVLGYWRCEEGWAFDAFMENRPIDSKNLNKNKNFKRGFMFSPQSKIYEIPDKESRKILDGTWTDFVMVYQTNKNKSGWLYIDTNFSQNLTGKDEPLVGCIEEKYICYE